MNQIEAADDVDLPATLDAFTASLRSAGRDWIGDRLTVLWADFMASRTAPDSDALTVWLIERIRLLGDLPHDILADAIDGAIKAARHGFIPSVGEIRAIADPAVDERRKLISRMQAVLPLLIDPDAVAARQRARDARQRMQEAFARQLGVDP